MSYYRLYFLNDKERIRGVVELDCASDAEACSAAARHAGGALAELWNLDRRVGRVGSAAPASAGSVETPAP